MSYVGKIKKYSRKAATTFKNEGFLAVSIKALTKLQKKQAQTTDNPILKKKFNSLVDRKNVMFADWSGHQYVKKEAKAKSQYTINWIMSPPAGGGGHQNIFRFIEFLDKLGHKNNVYLYSTFDDTTLEQAKKNVLAYCRAKNLDFYYFKGTMVPSDIVFATGWETAYPVFNLKTSAQKMYFIQDFEPLFYPMGTDYVLAENTYKFGFFGITAGGWLSDKLSREYGMRCDNYDFGADLDIYKLLNTGERKEIFFYARPVTERRGFDLGVMALEIFHKKMPEYTINMAGWDVSEWDVPFPYINHGSVVIEELPALYSRSAAALVISLTNMSLLPLELLATGTIPVVNAGPNNSKVSNNKYIHYTEPSPEALADALIEVITRPDLREYSEKASKTVPQGGWSEAKEKFIEILEGEFTHG